MPNKPILGKQVNNLGAGRVGNVMPLPIVLPQIIKAIKKLTTPTPTPTPTPPPFHTTYITKKHSTTGLPLPRHLRPSHPRYYHGTPSYASRHTKTGKLSGGRDADVGDPRRRMGKKKR